MNISQVYQSDSIKAADLQGRDWPLTITTVTAKNFNDGSKLLIRFAECRKQLVCNRTNAMAIAAQHGSETDGWIGHKITLFPTTCEYRGQQTDCIRIRPPAPMPAAPPPAPVEDPQAPPADGIPF